MALLIQSTPETMVDSFEVRIGAEKIIAHFGRRVPINYAAAMIKDWLDGLQRESPRP